ncbi:MAG: hypothetical protein ABI672_13045 [Vicinamibacteria bacterium]
MTLTWLLLASQVVASVSSPSRATVEAELTIERWGWQFPWLDRAYKAHEPRTRGVVMDGTPYFFDTERSRVFIEEGEALPEDGTPFLVETAIRVGDEVRIHEEMVIVHSWISYAESGKKPYCFRVFTTPYRRNHEVHTATFAIYDLDHDGTFEALEKVETLSSSEALKWRPPSRTTAKTTTASSRSPRFLTSVIDSGWRVPGWLGIASAAPSGTWEVRAGDVVVKAESFQPTTYDSSWLVTARETAHGLEILRSAITPRELVRYRLKGRVFCIWVRAGPWTFGGTQAAEWGWAYYDMDGDGDFERIMSAGDVVGSKQREWVPRLPEKK